MVTIFFIPKNNIVFDRQFTAEYIREEICDFIIKKKQIYEHL